MTVRYEFMLRESNRAGVGGGLIEGGEHPGRDAISLGRGPLTTCSM